MNALEPNERGIVFLVTIALLTKLLRELSFRIEKHVENPQTPKPEYVGILQELLKKMTQIVLSLFSTGAGQYVSTVMGGTVIEQPVYSLFITSIIVAVLYLVKKSLNSTQ